MNKESIKGRVLSIKGIALALLFIIFTASACHKGPAMTINGHTLNIEIAETADSRTLGLGNRDSLPDDQGMLFMFEGPGVYGFWMKGMRFALDFIWIKDGKVVQITPNVPKDSTEIYKSDMPVDSVLEVNAGWVAKNGVNVGDRADLTK